MNWYKKTQSTQQTIFTTSKGSTYVVHEDGSTTRMKSYHPEHGEKDQGAMERSQKTVYISEDPAKNLDAMQLQGWKDGQFPVLYPNAVAKQIAIMLYDSKLKKFIKRYSNPVSYKTSPEVGLYPIEVWKNGKDVHFGNKIVEVRQS